MAPASPRTASAIAASSTWSGVPAAMAAHHRRVPGQNPAVPALAERRTALVAVAALAALGAVLRLHFLDVPLNTDEAGFAQVARLWSEGHRLYGDTAWVDRPQGLLVLYR